MYSSKQGVL